MALSEDEQRQVVDAVDDWLSTPNVVSLKVWTKTVGGEDTGAEALVVGVVTKMPADRLGPEDVSIPAEVTVSLADGHSVTLPTDVVETGEIRTAALDGYVRPCPGGYKISCNFGPSWSQGTLGLSLASLANPSRVVFLTALHVVSPDGQNVPNPVIYQPASSDTQDQRLGSIVSIMPLTTYPTNSQKNPSYNQYDIAWGAPAASGSLAQLTVPGLLLNNTMGSATQRGRVSWLGQATGEVSSGTVSSTTGKVTVTLGQAPQQHWAWFQNVVEVQGPPVCQPGDSGAVAVDVAGAVVGLIFGYSTAHNQSYVCPIPPDSQWPS